jgi:hypothetical protein
MLIPAVDERIKELERGTFSQHAIETVCFDLRIRRAHAVTGRFAREKPRVQDAIDRFIIAHYRRGAPPGSVATGFGAAEDGLPPGATAAVRSFAGKGAANVRLTSHFSPNVSSSLPVLTCPLTFPPAILNSSILISPSELNPCFWCALWATWQPKIPPSW